MSKNKKPKKFLFEEVLAFLQHNSEKSFNYKQIGAAMEINSDSDRLQLIETLQALKQNGFVIEKEVGKFTIKQTQQYLSGTIDFTSMGTAFVVIEDRENDVFIPFRKTKDALQGDLVKIVLSSRKSGKRKEGEVVEVLQRAKTQFVGTLKLSQKFAFVIPDNTKIHVDFFINLTRINGAKDGQKVLVKLLEWKQGDQNPTAEVVEVFGYPGEHKTEMHAIMSEFGLPEKFSDEVEYYARNLNLKIEEAEIKRRRDFRNITTFTIDPYDAKDFDDALSLLKLENGNWEVGVHIADVTHYLKPGTVLDKEAVNRATSVYLVDRCIPMLPEVLSNFVCSLRPKEEKYTFSAVFEITNEGQILNEWFGKTIINSDRRFTYEEVQEMIEGKDGDYKEEVMVLDRLAKILRKERTEKGSLFFDKAEVKFNLDEAGKPLGVFFKTQKDAHKLIEDFMLLANRKVAEFLGKPKGAVNQNSKKGGNPSNLCVYRIHDVPSEEKMNQLTGFVARFGYKVDVGSKKKSVDSINKLLKDIKGKKEQSIIEILAIRSMPKAIYTTDHNGHYGLGFEYYTHFTSPIRRYPDVMVHRLLDARLNKETYSNQKELENLCKHSSDMERMAAEAERASVKFKQVEFMSDKIGQEFDGVISGITEWGIYVEIIENKCEGMIRSRDLKGDRYHFDEDNFRYVGANTGKTYALGDTVKVIIASADLLKKQLNMEFAETSESKKPPVNNKKRRGR
ncbi:MAG: ribonuclease R [Bacteroidia bacterium]|nr:ribonuclease R [Bacteroidia bacterium]